jgi:hypothetical protein
MGIVLRQDSKVLKLRNDDKFFNVRIGINIYPKFQEVLDVATTNGYFTPSFNGLRAGSQLSRNLDTNGFYENADVIFVSTWNNSAMENFSRIDWERLIVSNYLGGYTYEDAGLRGNKLNAYHDYLFNPSTQGVNYELNDACDVYFRSRRKSIGGTNYVEGCIGNAANRLRFETSNASVVNNFLNNGTTSPTLIDTFITPERGTQFSGTGTGGMYKRRILSTQILLGDKFGEAPTSSNSSVLPNFGTCGLRQQNIYLDHTQAFVWKGKGSFMTNEKFNDLRGFLNNFYSQIGFNQNA